MILILLAVPGIAENETSPLEVSHLARSIQPGEVVFVTVKSQLPLTRMEGKVFEKTFFFHSTTTDTVWQGLIGIDLTTPPGDYSVLLGGAASDGTPVKQRYELHVEHKAFPIRRLTVDEKFVNPPQEMLSRIHQESSRVAEVFATLNPDKIWEHSFLSPVPGAPTSGFGKQSILNGQPRSPHSGTDFEAEEGTPVKSPNQGIVVLVSNLYYSGNTVILDHGQGLYSYFAHLSRFGVKEGQMVWHGDRVGDVGATGRVTGAHLHWTVRLNGTRVDPLSLMEVLSNLD
ncbi:MAG: M23 family metallopeptidase [Acidobacteriota bacterium]|nr:M23 family metallopeptidase [Acidobacteriota bacterium]